jgi:glycosyltransferase involved in cell wall biosynthesis
MKVMFVHQNLPGQFLHLAPHLAALGHDVRGLTVEGNARKAPYPTYRYKYPAPPKVEGPGAAYAEAAHRGAVVARAAEEIARREGFVPDAVFGHAGWGETLFLREVFPAARHFAYAEFHYRAQGLDTGFDPALFPPSRDLSIRVVARAAAHSQAALLADACLSPTQWQKASYPAELQGKITVIHDGIDTGRVAPDAAASLTLPNGRQLTPGDEVLSYVSRHLEPYRGWHIFARALPEVLKRRPEAQVVIVGGDGQSYSPRRGDGQSWKDAILKGVEGHIDPARVHFLGQVPYPDFLGLMRVTRVHAYLTYPFVLSWSMLEAMSAGALVVGSRTPPVEEVIADGVNGRLVEFFDVGGWAEALVAGLADPTRDDPLRRAARQTVLDRYDLRAKSLPALTRFVTGG